MQQGNGISEMTDWLKPDNNAVITGGASGIGLGTQHKQHRDVSDIAQAYQEYVDQ